MTNSITVELEIRIGGTQDDVVLVEDEAELLVKFSRPATPEHPFMYHCHILEHEDAGMMGQYVCT
ncbi:MAG TPA: multicopper oxidase domain-containing protein [Bradyrhizobium sp.]|nr:multicopper oxidase domain-containing protein [Bradyrhizobium sp.]